MDILRSTSCIECKNLEQQGRRYRDLNARKVRAKILPHPPNRRPHLLTLSWLATAIQSSTDGGEDTSTASRVDENELSDEPEEYSIQSCNPLLKHQSLQV